MSCKDVCNIPLERLNIDTSQVDFATLKIYYNSVDFQRTCFCCERNLNPENGNFELKKLKVTLYTFQKNEGEFSENIRKTSYKIENIRDNFFCALCAHCKEDPISLMEKDRDYRETNPKTISLNSFIDKGEKNHPLNFLLKKFKENSLTKENLLEIVHTCQNPNHAFQYILDRLILAEDQKKIAELINYVKDNVKYENLQDIIGEYNSQIETISETSSITSSDEDYDIEIDPPPQTFGEKIKNFLKVIGDLFKKLIMFFKDLFSRTSSIQEDFFSEEDLGEEEIISSDD